MIMVAGGSELPTAIISDVHGNLEALHAVLDDIDRRGVEKIVCLGDIVGYGPNPRECVDLIMQRCAWSLMGNHDFAVLYEPTNFNVSAEASAWWTRDQLRLEPDPETSQQRWSFLGNLKIRLQYLEALWVHASPRRPINEYIFPEDVNISPQKMTQIFDRIKRRCFVGHTHVTGVFTDEPWFYPPNELGGSYEFNEHEKCVINPGSVGQPRDRDPRTSYAILYDDHIDFIRLDYDVQTVVEKIKAIPELSDFLCQRLLEGR